MRALLTITLNDLRIFLSKPGSWISLGLLPVLFTVVLGFAFSSGSSDPTLRVDVIDEDNSARSVRFLTELRNANETLLLCPMDALGDSGEDRCGLADEPLTLEKGQERLREGESAALLVIPAGYGAALENFTNVQIDYYSATDPTSPDPVRQTLDAVMRRVNGAALTAAVAGGVLDRISTQRGASAAIDSWRDSFVSDVYSKTEMLMAQRPPAVHYVATGGAQESGVNEGFRQSVPGTGSMYVMFTVLGGVAILLRERKRWTLQRLGVLPIRRSQILGGKILTYFTLGMMQYLIVFAVGLVVGLDFGPHPLLLLPVMVTFVLCCTALAFAIAPFLNSEGQASVMAQLLSLTLASIGGAWWPLEIVPEFMQRIGHLSPVAWAMDAFQDLLFYGGGFAQILPEMAVLLAAAAALFGVGVWRFRYV